MPNLNKLPPSQDRISRSEYNSLIDTCLAAYNQFPVGLAQTQGILSPDIVREPGCWARIIGPVLDTYGNAVFDFDGYQLWQWAEEIRYQFTGTNGLSKDVVNLPDWVDAAANDNQDDAPRGSQTVDLNIPVNLWTAPTNAVVHVAREANGACPVPGQIVWLYPGAEVVLPDGTPDCEHIFVLGPPTDTIEFSADDTISTLSVGVTSTLNFNGTINGSVSGS